MKVTMQELAAYKVSDDIGIFAAKIRNKIDATGDPFS